MTEAATTQKVRSRGLKTWSAFGNLGRRPTEYEILTHNLNHTNGVIPLEMGPDVHGNVWLREHRDSIKLTLPDWDAFRDPDAVTYGSYMAGQDDQETYIEGLLEQFDRDGYDALLPSGTLDLLGRALTPSRYLAHGLQMLSAYIQQLAISSYISNCAVFQTADELRRVQLTAYRTTQLQLSYPDRGYGTGERAIWESSPEWQPIRRAVELALIEYDWDRALVVTNLVVKPVTDLLLLHRLGKQFSTIGAHLDALILENLWRDSERSQRWTKALIELLTQSDTGNLTVLQGYLDEFAPLGQAIVEAGSHLLMIPDGGQGASEVAAEVSSGWVEQLEAVGLKLGSG
jgi:toluene monooxygenase system protein E